MGENAANAPTHPTPPALSQPLVAMACLSSPPHQARPLPGSSNSWPSQTESIAFQRTICSSATRKTITVAGGTTRMQHSCLGWLTDWLSWAGAWPRGWPVCLSACLCLCECHTLIREGTRIQLTRPNKIITIIIHLPAKRHTRCARKIAVIPQHKRHT